MIKNKKALFLIGGILTVTLIAWVVLIVTIFRKEPEKETPAGQEEEQEELPPVVTVFRMTKFYQHAGGEKRLVVTYEYNENGQRVKATMGPNFGQSYTEFVYDSDGRLGEEHEFNADGTKRSVTMYAYDEQGRETEIKKFENSGNLMFMDSFDTVTYDDENRKSFKYRWKAGEGERYPVSMSEYDEGQRVILLDEYDKSKRLVRSVMYTYNEDGNPLKEYRYIPTESENPDSERDYSLYSEYEYDPESVRKDIPVSQTVLEKNGEQFSKTTMECDAYGNVIRMKTSYGSATATDYEYEYERMEIPAEFITDTDRAQIKILKDLGE